MQLYGYTATKAILLIHNACKYNIILGDDDIFITLFLIWYQVAMYALS